MKRKNGFTLVELMIAIAMAGFILGTLGQIIMYGMDNYNVNIQLSEMMRKITPVLARIEADLTESSDDVPPKIPKLQSNSSSTAIVILTKEEETHEYRFGEDDNGNKGIYREKSNERMMLLRHSETSKEGFVKVKKFEFEYYKFEDPDNEDYTLEKITTATISQPEEVVYIRIIVELEGTGKNQPTLNFSTGIKLP